MIKLGEFMGAKEETEVYKVLYEGKEPEQSSDEILKLIEET